MNPWPIYEHMKKSFRDTGNRLTAKEVRGAFPNASMTEMREGMIEFELAYESTFKHEQRPFVSELIEEILGR